jgi:hypothetical protein
MAADRFLAAALLLLIQKNAGYKKPWPDTAKEGSLRDEMASDKGRRYD